MTFEKNVKVGPFCSIGCDGFQVDRKLKKIVSHKGKIIIKNNVEILSHCDIDLGLNDEDITIINENCKLSHYVHIGHNCILGKDTIVAGNTNIGSAKIGENCYIHPGCIIQSKVEIGNNVIITIGSIVTKNIDHNKKVSGFWAIDHDKWVKFIKSIR